MRFGVPSNWWVTFFCGAAMQFNKPPLSYQEQISQLKARGLVIDDEQQAEHYLKHLNYYRLSGYWLPFEQDHASHRFKPDARFEDVLNLYVFDRELRLLLLDAIERIEISVRATWAYVLASKYGAHAYLDSGHCHRADWHQSNLSKLAREIERSDELFITHYKAKYTEPQMPPVWSVVEVMSLGMLSHWITNLKPSDRADVALNYQLNEQVLKSFIRHLTYVRNLCAHHSRVWNRKLTVTTKPPKKPQRLKASCNLEQPRRIYNTLVICHHFMGQISPGSTWTQRLLKLVEQHNIDPKAMGFPANWQSLELWKEANAQ